jgi:hypothetical protein
MHDTYSRADRRAGDLLATETGGSQAGPRSSRPVSQSDLASLLSELPSVPLSLSFLAPFSFFPGSAVEE